MIIQVTDLSIEDRLPWEQLYRAYADFYEVPMTPEILDRVWEWIFATDYPFYALMAKTESGEALGMMHYREMPSPLRGAKAGFLDDLYVLPAFRGRGGVQALFKKLKQVAKSEGWPFVRWITAENNYRGRAVYDKVAERTQWLTYQMNS
ncbi:MAG TPA: GNAT family N-acetyltransferase [Aeromonadales bacterium]|nr:GNAT family N-acetyltransferase [Aeromonadales bacterium]